MYLLPFAEDEHTVFLKTIIPSRKATKQYLGSNKDLEAIQKRALAEGLPYQTLIASLLHKYASGRRTAFVFGTRPLQPRREPPGR